MRILELTRCGMQAAVEQCAAELLSGGAVIYPTDTVYALAVLPNAKGGVETAYAAKARRVTKPLSLCVGDLQQASEYVAVDDRVQALASAFLPGPLTIICKALGSRLENIQAGFPGIGIRIPSHPFGPNLAQHLGHPITATSANISGRLPAIDRESAIRMFSKAIEKPRILVDDGRSQLGFPSTIIDVTKNEADLIREGTISFDRILAALR